MQRNVEFESFAGENLKMGQDRPRWPNIEPRNAQHQEPCGDLGVGNVQNTLNYSKNALWGELQGVKLLHRATCPKIGQHRAKMAQHRTQERPT